VERTFAGSASTAAPPSTTDAFRPATKPWSCGYERPAARPSQLK